MLPLFLLLLLIQHFGGVVILIKGERFNATHRKFAILVTNSGRFLVVFGLILAQKEQYLIVGSAAISLVLLVATIK